MKRVIRVISTSPCVASPESRGFVALSKIGGVANLECPESDDSSAVFTYEWTKPGHVFMETDEHLGRHYLVRDWDYDPLQR